MSSFEWQIRQIHDSLQSNNVKHAIQQCQKYIRKHPEALVFKIMYSLCLVSSKKLSEANSTVEKLLSEISKQDSISISIMKCVLEKLDRSKDIISMYETAITEQPFNEEISHDYFGILIENMNFYSAYQLSIKSYKRFNDHKYYLWSILVLYHQTQLSKSTTTIKLVQKMIQKALQDNLFNTFQEYSICLLVPNYEEQFLKQLLSIPDKIFPVKVDSIKWKLEFLKSSDHASKVVNIVKSFDSPFDDWNIIECYINACKQLDLSLAETIFWDKDSFLAPFQQRTCFLAEMHMYSLWECIDSITKCIMDYFDNFGHKESCFSDLLPYLQISKIDYVDICLNHFLSASNITGQMNGDDQEKLLTILKIVKYLKPSHSCDSITSTIICNETTKERKATLLMLSIVDMIEKSYKDDSLGYDSRILFQIAVSINNEINKLDNYAPLKLILISILREMRGTTLALEIFKSLDIKSIQMDILGYLVFDWISVTSYPKHVIENCISMLSIYSSNEKDTPTMLAKAFQNGSFSQTADFVDFYIRLSNSLQRKTYQIMKIQAELVQSVLEMSNVEKCLSCVSSILSFEIILYDNRSIEELYSVWWSFNPISKFIQRNELKGIRWVNICHAILITLDMIYHDSEYENKNEIKTLLSQVISDVTTCKKSSGIVSIFSLALYICQNDESMILKELGHANDILSHSIFNQSPIYSNLTPDKHFEILDEFVETVHYLSLYCVGLLQSDRYISRKNESFSIFSDHILGLIRTLKSANQWIESFIPDKLLFDNHNEVFKTVYRDWENIIEKSSLLVERSLEMLQLSIVKYSRTSNHD